MGIENRYYFHEIPSYEEVGVILKTFEGAPIGYWHDVGHAEVLSRLKVCPHEKWLSSYNKYLIGTHIHDVNDQLEDHFAPTKGTIDFDKIIPYLKNTPIKIFEVQPKSTAEEIIAGFDYLKEKGL
ncbi:MAG TPA: hypothetical protein ENG63_04925 [Candidatus Desulfofervidus auxilii]|uniref:Sugar phosphate isomerase/epimerase n=1 Tax=Desulfofervidus auxilii TaxID=1621989 RepID=A0A7C0Y2H6_DESA2|nr:hypothetical protein [Candidatus Desulfofervidus auxilii]